VSCCKNKFTLFFQVFLYLERMGNNINSGSRAGLYMKLLLILENTLNYTQVFGVVCLSTIVSHYLLPETWLVECVMEMGLTL
jgi:hypothetical protein